MLLTIALAALLLSQTHAWNTDVHNQIGFMATTFLTPETLKTLTHILPPAYNSSIGRAASWADGYAHTPEGRFSYPWHWIDSSDHPPTSCNVSYTDDCSARGCVVRAIANQTSILRECVKDVRTGLLRDGSNATCGQALMWVVHFLGDIAQPLHASGLGAGGNTVNVTFGGQETELHAVWDGFILYAAAQVPVFSTTELSPFMKKLLARLLEDDFLEPTADWVKCTDPTTPIDCALQWARESNKWTCNYVYSELRNDTDLLTSGYAEGAFPIVEMQVSKAAVRLGIWLNRLVEEEEEQVGQVVLRTGQTILSE